ncbi:MAG: electron transfer flavoprotein subunit alpha/FixB family protein [Nitrososphaerales archaeon]|nr:electron transfer flavoprotein subunit alpha/FixB family protein [Nitrososphaerales archaeon]
MSDGPTDVWVYLQHDAHGLTRESLELIAAGRKVADTLKQDVVGVIIGHRVRGMAEQAIQYGADEVLYVDSPEFETYFNLRYIDAVHSMIVAKNPYIFLFVANELGKDIAARIAYRVRTGLATDNVQLEIEDYFNPQLKENFKNLLIQIRPDFGTRLARIYTPKTRPQMATVRPGNFIPLEPDPKRKGRLEEFNAELKEYPAKVKEVVELPKPPVDLAGSDVVICLGLGVLNDKSGKARNPKDAYNLAVELKSVFENKYAMKAEIGATRSLIYAEVKELQGLLDRYHQIGQTGATVSPKLYFAFGVSGALQHRVGMSRSRKIVAINTDPNAPILQMAHYPIVGDLYEELPKLIHLLGGDRAAV